jgi:hypothetical protein
VIRGLPHAFLDVTGNTLIDPGLGNQWSYSFSGPGATNLYQVLLVAVRCVLVTDATVKNRYPGLNFSIGGRVFLLHSPNAITAGLTRTLVWMVGESYIQTAGTTVENMTLPFPIVLNSGDTLNSDIANMQAGDQLTLIYLRWMRAKRSQ